MHILQTLLHRQSHLSVALAVGLEGNVTFNDAAQLRH